MKRVLGIILLIAVLGTAANDISRWVKSQQQLTRVTDALSTRAMDDLNAGLNRDQSAADLAATAAAQGVTVYQYDQNPQRVQVWTQAPVNGTWVIGPVAGLISGKPFGEALKTPLMIRDYQSAGL